LKNASSVTRRRRFGTSRWLVLLLIIASVFVVRAVSPVMPGVTVAPERIGEMYLTDSLVGLFIVDGLLIAVAFAVRRALRRGQMVLRGLAGATEAIVEALYNLTESTAGKWARQVFPWVAGIILVVLVGNLVKLLPGVESIGLLHVAEGEGKGHAARHLFMLGNLPVTALVNRPPAEGEELYSVVPFVRGVTTDLNFTVGLALISVFMTQVIGVRAAGLGYFKKFFNLGRLAKMWTKERLGPFEAIFPFLDLFVGLLELIAEFAKIISFSFRLFGNMFAGAVLLFIIGILVPVFVPSGVVLFEVFVGLIQALVFGMLTLVFMTMATKVHG